MGSQLISLGLDKNISKVMILFGYVGEVGGSSEIVADLPETERSER